MPGLPTTVLIVDVETTEGENPKINEVGAVHYSVEHQSIISCFSSLVSTNPEGIPGGPNTISQIDPGLVEWHGLTPGRLKGLICDRLGILPTHSKNITFIAHNTEHERQYLSHEKWLCTHADFDLFPPNYAGKKDLFSMAIANGVGISRGHRAIYDCLLIAEIFNRRPNLEADFKYAQLPHIEAIAPTGEKDWRLAIASHRLGGTLIFQWDRYRQGWFGRLDILEKPEVIFDDCNALITGDNACGNIFLDKGERIDAIAIVPYADRDLAKQYGFRWYSDNKIWRKKVNPLALNAYPSP